MKWYLMLMLGCSCWLVNSSVHEQPVAAAEKWVEELNEFSFRVANQMEQDLEQGELICCPLGVLTTLDMMREGAAAETRKQLDTFLPLNSSQMELLRNNLNRWQQPEEEQVLFGASLAENDGYGMRTLRVMDGSPAEGSGLAVGDLVFEIDGKPILSSDDYNTAIDAAGKKIAFVFFDRSQGKLIRKNVVLAVVSDNNPGRHLVVANSLWYRKEFRLNPEFAGAIASRPNTQVRVLPAEPAEAARALNEWSSQLLQESVRPFNADQLKEDAKLVAANLASVSGQWRHQFDPEKTNRQPFRVSPGQTMPVDMMAMLQQLTYAEQQGWKAVVLPMQKGKVDVLFVLPPADAKENNGQRAAAVYPQLTKSLKTASVDLQLPRVTFETRHQSVNVSLAKMGLTLPFDAARADFSRLTEAGMPETFISEFFQQASFQMDEYGARATAVTAAISTPRFSAAGPGKTFHANRPFRFYVRESTSGLILFAGHFTAPAERQE